MAAGEGFEYSCRFCIVGEEMEGKEGRIRALLKLGIIQIGRRIGTYKSDITNVIYLIYG